MIFTKKEVQALDCRPGGMNRDGVFAHCDPDRCGIWTTFYGILNMQHVIGGYCGYGREPSTEDMKLFMERMRERVAGEEKGGMKCKK